MQYKLINIHQAMHNCKKCQIIDFIIKMATVGLSQGSQRLSSTQKSNGKQVLRQTARQKSQQKEISLLTEGMKVRDSEIATLKNIITSLKSEGKVYKTALTTESDCDPIDRSDIRLSTFPLCSTIETYREELEIMNKKYTDSCNVISQLEAKLKFTLTEAKNREEQLKNQIEILKEDVKYMKEEHSRNIDCLNIQMQHRQNERMKVTDNRHKQQIQILNEQVRTLRMDNSEKQLQITRLNEKIKKERCNNDGNVKFIENQNTELRDKIEKISIVLKEEFRKREQGLIAQFQVDLQLLHQEQAGEIRVLCDRIRILKSLLEEKESQLKQLWKARGIQAESLFSTKCEPRKPYPEEMQLSTIDKYLKQSK